MDAVSMEELLKADGEKLRSELRADTMIDKNRDRSVERLREAFGEALLRYNAANVGDRTRQALADCLTATADELLPLLLAGTIREEKTKRRVRTGAVIALLLATVCALGAALLTGTYRIAGFVLLGLCAVFTFAAGRLWLQEREVKVSQGLDADAVWKTLCRTGETMDRKIESFSAQAKAWEEELLSRRAAGEETMDPEELQLFSDLLEALYSQSGEYSLRQLKKIRPYLRRRGIEIVDYDAENAMAFEMLPTKNAPGTLRPALMAGDRILLTGRAAEHVD